MRCRRDRASREPRRADLSSTASRRQTLDAGERTSEDLFLAVENAKATLVERARSFGQRARGRSARKIRGPSSLRYPALMNRLDHGEVLCGGRYTVIRRLGAGVAGVGYLCSDAKLKRQVVCKVALEASEASSNEFRLQFQRLLDLRSDRMVSVLGFDEEDKHAVVILEWIGGLDLLDWKRTSPALNDRLRVLADVASTLTLIHEAGGAHGDLWGGVNILTNSARGCVLIDPQPDLWGSVSASDEKKSDFESLADLISQLASEYADRSLSPAVNALSGDYSIQALRSAASLLKKTATDTPIIPGSNSIFEAAGLSYQQQVQRTNEEYRQSRILRRDAFAELSERIRVLASMFGLDFHIGTTNEATESERDQRGRGYFVERLVQCSSPTDDGTFLVAIDEVRDFYKPVPYVGGTIGAGRWSVRGVERAGGRVEIRVNDNAASIWYNADRAHLMYPPPTTDEEDKEFHLLDEAWLHARIAELTGTSLA